MEQGLPAFAGVGGVGPRDDDSGVGRPWAGHDYGQAASTLHNLIGGGEAGAVTLDANAVEDAVASAVPRASVSAKSFADVPDTLSGSVLTNTIHSAQ